MSKKIFLSAVSSQFKPCRDALASDLRAIGCEVRVQEDFQQGPRTLLERLEDYVTQCDRVIALVGDAYGYEAGGDALPANAPPRSYTQWEYYFARGERLREPQPVAAKDLVTAKDLYVYFATDEFLLKHPVQQSPEHAERQQHFIRHVKATGKHRTPFDSLDKLCRLVLRDGWQMTERPPKLHNLPYATLGTLFKGRDDFLANIERHFAQEPARPVVIHGLGGIGKSRLAIEYAHRHSNQYDALLLISADSPAALQRNLAALCHSNVLNLDLPKQTATDESVQRNAVLRWFNTHPNWLLILDNVDGREAAVAVEKLLPSLQNGQVLIAARYSNWSGSVTVRELRTLSEDDATAFLLERTQNRRITASDHADARALAKTLDGLALALEQTGAFIGHTRIALADYLARWRQREKKVLAWYDARLMHYPCSVAVTWDTSVAQLDAPALALLRLLSWFAPEPIPRALLETEAAQRILDAGVGFLGEAGELPEITPLSGGMENALALLASFSLLRWEEGNAALRVHGLVQEVTRERLEGKAPEGWLRNFIWTIKIKIFKRLEGEVREFWLREVLRLVNDYLSDDRPPQDVRSWPVWDTLRPHVMAVTTAADAAGIAEPTSRLMSLLGLLLMEQAEWPEAEPLLRRALAIDEHHHGEEHPDVARDLNNLATLLHATNRTDKAERLMRRALDIDEHHYGAVHPRVASHLGNLASLLLDTHRTDKAEPLMRRALAIDEHHYGTVHPKVATSLNSLAVLLCKTNRRAKAEPLLRRALAIDEHSYDAKHATIAIRLENLAQLLRDTNRLTDAEPLMRRVLEILIHFNRTTGHEHPRLPSAEGNYVALLEQMDQTPEQIRAQLNAIAEPFGLTI